MDTNHPGSDEPTLPETDAERQRRIAEEAVLIREAQADVAAGRIVSQEDMEAWFDSLGTDYELPVPQSGR